jgi:hypothetical protein
VILPSLLQYSYHNLQNQNHHYNHHSFFSISIYHFHFMFLFQNLLILYSLFITSSPLSIFNLLITQIPLHSRIMEIAKYLFLMPKDYMVLTINLPSLDFSYFLTNLVYFQIIVYEKKDHDDMYYIVFSFCYSYLIIYQIFSWS